MVGFRRSAPWLAAILLAAACARPPIRPPATPTPLPPRPTPGPREPAPPPTGLSRVDLARSLVGRAYRYGGDGPRAFDCSGLVLYVLEREGVKAPRSTREQARFGSWVPLDELEAGDLVFFGEARGEPHHVGIVTSRPGEPLRMIHASTSNGVVETEILESAYWLRRLRFGRRVDVR